MKIVSMLILTAILSSCASSVPPLISKPNCKNTCAVNSLEYKDYDDEDGCYCGAYED